MGIKAGAGGRLEGEDRGLLGEDRGALDGSPQLLVDIVTQQRMSSVKGPPRGTELVVVGLELVDPAFDSGGFCPNDQFGRLQRLCILCGVGSDWVGGRGCDCGCVCGVGLGVGRFSDGQGVDGSVAGVCGCSVHSGAVRGGHVIVLLGGTVYGGLVLV